MAPLSIRRVYRVVFSRCQSASIVDCAGSSDGSPAAATMAPLWSHVADINGASSTTTSNAVSDACAVNTTGIPKVVAAAAAVDTVVLALGGDCHEGEGTDRDFLHLPGAQSELFKAVLATGKKVVVVIVRQ